MDINLARNFDKDRNFQYYWKNDRVGAALWVIKLAEATLASCSTLTPVQELFNVPMNSQNEAVIREKLPEYEQDILAMGNILSLPLGKIDKELLSKLGWLMPGQLPAPVITGRIRVEPSDETFGSTLRESSGQIQPLLKMLKLEAGVYKYTLVCPYDPLESFGADLSPFEGAYEVALRGWPDGSGKIYVTETAPVMNLDGYKPGDFAQGRLYDNGIKGSPVVLRVNSSQQTSIVDKDLQEELRPFVGTGVILYAQRTVDPLTGKVSLENVYKNYWVLCRLTDVKDDTYQLPQAPLPAIQKDFCLCIGGTPPWNWTGPNIRTHLLTPINTIGLIRTTERRLVFGKILSSLPDGIQNPIPDVKRVMQVITTTEKDIDIEAHWGTRLGPVSQVYHDLSGVAHLMSAFNLVKSVQAS